MFRIVKALLWLLRRPCYEIGRKGLPRFLTRWTLWGDRFSGGWRLSLHCFHRGDCEPYFHDHPWPFVSVILAGGYWEHTPAGRRWYGPLRLLRRPATWQHRVALPPGARCWTLIWSGQAQRKWGFWCPQSGWRYWKEHQASQDAGGSGCE